MAERARHIDEITPDDAWQPDIDYYLSQQVRVSASFNRSARHASAYAFALNAQIDNAWQPGINFYKVIRSVGLSQSVPSIHLCEKRVEPRNVKSSWNWPSYLLQCNCNDQGWNFETPRP